MIDIPTIEKYAAALKFAEAAALEANKPGAENDGGTCNFDSPTIDFTGWRQPDIDKLNEVFGSEIIGNKISGKYWKGHRWVNTTTYGQAANRTRMAEAANKVLKAHDIPASMYYQAD